MKKPVISSILLAACINISFADQDVVDRATTTIQQFRAMPEHGIPHRILHNARGLVILNVIKAGFIFSGRGGKGVVVARTRHGWSGPSFIATGGAGWGAQIGAEVTDFVFVLNNEAAVRAFSRGGNVTLGADVSAAAGPIGRAAEADVTPKAAMYTYSKSKGLFVGASLEGAVIRTVNDENASYYGRPVTPYQVLHGQVRAPAGAARLRTALGR